MTFPDDVNKSNPSRFNNRLKIIIAFVVIAIIFGIFFFVGQYNTGRSYPPACPVL